MTNKLPQIKWLIFLDLWSDLSCILVCQVCQASWPISEVQIKDLTDKSSDFLCECCKNNKFAGKKLTQSEVLEISAASTTSSSTNALAIPRASSTFVAEEQDGSSCIECFPPCFRLFRNSKRAACVSKSTGSLPSKATSTNSSAAEKDLRRAAAKKPLSLHPPLLHPPLRKVFVCGVRSKAPEDVENFASRILVVNGADCIVETVDLLQSYCPTYSLIVEHAYRGCLKTLGSIIDDIMPKTIIIVQLGDIDLFQYEFRKNGSWSAKFENFITKMIEKRAFVYVSYIQSQITTDCWRDKALQFNKVIKKISKRNNAYFIDVLSKFLGKPWLFDYTGIRLNALGDDLLTREWGQRITELSHLDRISQEKLSRREVISKQLYAQMVNPNDPKIRPKRIRSHRNKKMQIQD